MAMAFLSSRSTWASLFLTFIIFHCCGQTRTVSFRDANIAYEGRIAYKDQAAELIWSGTSATLWFQGTLLSAILQDVDTANYYNAIIDDTTIVKINPDTTKRSYVLASGLSKGNHKVQLFKRTEWDKGKTLFFGFEVEDSATVLPPQPKPKRKIEFYGNSITCGYGVEDTRGKDSRDGYFENNYITYAALTARHFNAQYSCIGKSGIGVMVSWFPLIMPEMYDRLDPTDSLSKWDFSQYTPDVVVIDLFQNDSWIINQPENAQFRARFGTKAPDEKFIVNAYKDFVSSIRKKYPRAQIICSLGNMDATREGSPWPGYVQKAIAGLKDKKIRACFFPYKNTGGHPRESEQKAMAESLIAFIEQHIKW